MKQEGPLRRAFLLRLYDQSRINLRYAQAFWEVVVLGCIDARNWDYCFPVDRWLVPYLEDLWRYYNEEPYSSEKETLKDANSAIRGPWPANH